jgi:hypothetical protein
MFLSVGFFAIFWVFGNVDYATVFSVAPFINESAITIVGLLLLVGAMAKSAQIGLHTWLPDRMEGLGKFMIYRIDFVNLTLFVYITNILARGCPSLVEVEFLQAGLPVILTTLPPKVLETITGNMLGDGSIGYNNMSRNNNVPKGNCRYRMTIMASAVDYMQCLFDKIYAPFSNVALHPYPNPAKAGNENVPVTQYNFSTKSLPLFTTLHSLWYRYDVETSLFVKTIPDCIDEMFSEISLAHWIMEDGYFDNHGRTKTVILCTECFTLEECKLLQSVLFKINIVSTLKVRNSIKGTHRIRVSKRSMPLLRELVTPHMHPYFMYKLGQI